MSCMAFLSIALMLIGFIGMYKYPTDYGFAITALIGVSCLPWPVITVVFFCIGKCVYKTEPLASLYEV